MDRKSVGQIGLLSRLVMLLVLILMLGGCSNFRSSKNVDMAPFAENTINLMADIRHGMDSQNAVYLREYADTGAGADYTAAWNVYRPVLRGIAAYSLAIVTISKSNMNDKQRCEKLAEVLDKFLRPRIHDKVDNPIITEPELDEMIANIRAQTKYLDGLNAAQPLVDSIEIFSHEYLDFMDLELNLARDYLQNRVNEDHATTQKFYKMLVGAQNLAFEDLVLVRDFRQGYDPDAIKKLLEIDPQLGVILPADKEPTQKDLMAAEERLLYRLDQINDLVLQVQPDLDLYRNKMVELDALYKGAINNQIKTRTTVIIWSRAHRGLAAGITNPANIDVMGIARRALSAAMPI